MDEKEEIGREAYRISEQRKKLNHPDEPVKNWLTAEKIVKSRIKLRGRLSEVGY